jgi:arginine:ornithine antiporter/lysine permease
MVRKKGKASAAASTSKKDRKLLGFIPLTGLVVGSMIGSGVFELNRRVTGGGDNSVLSILVGWLIVGLGMLALAFCFMNLNKKKPNLNAGIYSYAKDGFGKFVGFNSAWGYWISAWVGNLAYAALLFGSLGFFFSAFGDGSNKLSVICASVVMWGLVYLVIRGVKSASFINAVVTIAKLVPLFIFLIAVLFAFRLDVFTSDFWGSISEGNTFHFGDLLTQTKTMMTAMVFAFIGIEGAVIFSGSAKNKKDVGRATVLGFLTVLAVYILITVLALGVKTIPELADLPLGVSAMAQVMEYMVGHWGAVLISLGAIVSISGAWLAWTMFAAELPAEAARQGDFPKVFAKENEKHAPVAALLITGVVSQLFLFLFLTDWGNDAYGVAMELCTVMALLPYALVALYQLKVSLKEKSETPKKGWNVAVGLFAVAYSIWLVIAFGVIYLAVSALLYAPGIVAYIIAQRQHRAKKMFSGWDVLILVVIVFLALWAVKGIANGTIHPDALWEYDWSHFWTF